MVKKAILLLAAAACFVGTVSAQVHCFTDETQARVKKDHPEIANYEAQLKADIDNQLKKINLNKYKTTGIVEEWEVMDIPIVFHIVHDYGVEYVSDNDVYQALKEINQMYNKQNPDTSDVIPPYKGKIRGTNVRYIGDAKIVFHLPTKDPFGNPTHGITRHRSYLASAGSDQAKFDIWPPDSYLNIWIIRAFDESHLGAAAYAYQPPTAAVRPWVDGVIGIVQGNNINLDNTIAHEIGHSLSLDHPWGSASGLNGSQPPCGDDGIDDTPPTHGHTINIGCTFANLYDDDCVLKDTFIAKPALNVFNDVVGNQNGVGIKFKTLDKINIDTITFYPVDSGKPYQIVLKKDNTIIGTYNGITTNNKVKATIGKIDSTSLLPPFIPQATDADSLTGVGISFKAYDSVYIKSVTFFPTDSASAVSQPYQIVLKRNGVIVDSYSGVTDALASTKYEVAPVSFEISSNDTNDIYKIEFAVNPGARRTVGSAMADGIIPGIIKFISDTTHVSADTALGIPFAFDKYNYFYHWDIRTFIYAERPVVRFLAPYDTLNPTYSLEFSNNPGARHDLGSAVGNDTIPNVIQFVSDTSQGRYNYFYNWRIRFGDYFKIYSPATAFAFFGDSTITRVDYPDTVNSQNVMDYTYCSKMFTHLQTWQMRATLQSSVAGRSNLVSAGNLAATGALDPWPDLAPIADFSIEGSKTNPNRFVCVNQNISFRNRSWQDTVSSVQWNFPTNGAATTTSTSLTGLVNKFTTPGWATVSLTANSNAGSNTITDTNAIYVADPNAISPVGYFQEFNQNGDLDKYPIFNYFKNDSKWEVVNNAGFYDNTSIRYKNYDTRTSVAALIGTPRGDYDDFFTPAFDVTQAGSGNIYLSFYSAGAFRTNNPTFMNDTVEISYSTNCSQWTLLKTLTKSQIGNNGTLPTTEYTPAGFWEWQGQNILLPTAAKTSKVYFRFRFRSGAEAQSLFGSGNHFYLDRIHISPFTTDAGNLENENAGIALAPNPTTGSTSVIIKDAKSTTAQIQVTDITGKIVYSTTAKLNGNISRVEIPANYIAVKGMYLVQVTTGSVKQTEKLVVY